MLVPAWMGTNMAVEKKKTETSVPEFWYKSVNLFLEELINIKVILFLIHELLRQHNSPKYVRFLTYMTALLAVCKCHVTQKLMNPSILYHKTKNSFEAKICMKISFQLL